MQELEKIMEGIDEEIKSSVRFSSQRTFGLIKAKEIIRKYMSGKDSSIPDNDGWIPVEKRMPEDDMPTPKLVTALVPDRKAGWDTSETFSVVVDTDVYDPGYTGKWECYKKNVIAWRPLPDPYRPERRTSDD